MAEENKVPQKQGWFMKLINWFKNLPGRIAKAFKNMVAELHKVTWPSKKKWISSCITVLVFMLVMGVVVSVLDFGSAGAVNGLYALTHPEAEQEEQYQYTQEELDALLQQMEAEAAAEGAAESTEGDAVTTEDAAESTEGDAATTEDAAESTEGDAVTTGDDAAATEGEQSEVQ